jgi:hypothetical protein
MKIKINPSGSPPHSFLLSYENARASLALESQLGPS